MSKLMLSGAMVSSLLSNKQFLAKFPMFASIPSMVGSTRRSGCSGCAKRRQATNTMNAFLAVMRGLSPTKINELKQFVSADSIMYNTRENGRYKVGNF